MMAGAFLAGVQRMSCPSSLTAKTIMKVCDILLMLSIVSAL